MERNPKISPFAQFGYFVSDYKRAVGRKRSRAIFLWMSMPIIGILVYRIERFLFLLFGGGIYKIIRVLAFPILEIVKSLTHLDINYTADIGPGIIILHSSMGIVISGRATIGCNVTLVGGNVIGIENSRADKGEFRIGDNVFLGANAVIIGPVSIGDNAVIGASSCVVKDAPPGCTLSGVPARIKV